MKRTSNYNLKKPEITDTVDIEDFNYTADIIDTKIKEMENKAASIPTKTSQLTNDWGFLISSPITSVNGKTGSVSLSAKDMFNNWASDEDVTKYLTWQPHSTIEVSQQLLKLWIDEYSNNEVYNWAIELKEKNV